jgi:hypothetical protein
MLFFMLVLLGLTLSGCVSKEGKVQLSYTKDKKTNVELLEKYDFDSVEIRLLTGFSNDAVHVRTDKGYDTIYKQVNTNLSIAFARTLIIPTSHSTAKKMFLTIKEFKYTIPISYKYLFCDVSIDSFNILSAYYNNEILILSKHQRNKQYPWCTPFLFARQQGNWGLQVMKDSRLVMFI